MMLSRIAESLFWIGRYIERADGTARILDAHLQLLLEDPWIDEDIACRSLLAVMGSAPDPGAGLTRHDVVAVLAADRYHSASITYSLNAARENARRAREIVSSDLWECLNRTRNSMARRITQDRILQGRAGDFFAWVQERSALALGIVESSSTRDDTYHFFTLGRSLERADMTARLLATRTLTEASGPSWTTILRSCGAYEAYLRRYRGVPSSRNAAEFLLMDRKFPRSVLFSLNQADACLLELTGGSERGPVGHAILRDEARRAIGRMRADLEYRPLSEILDDLPAGMATVQEATSAASEAIRERFFPTMILPIWAGESL